jgi:hypothetical protein
MKCNSKKTGNGGNLAITLPLLFTLMQQQKNTVYCSSMVDNNSVRGCQAEQKEKIKNKDNQKKRVKTSKRKKKRKRYANKK